MATYLKIAAVGSIFIPINTQVISIFKVKGKAGFLLKIETVWKIVALILIILFSIYTTFETVLWMVVILNSIMGFVYLYFCSKEIKYSFSKEFKVILLLISYFYVSGYISDTLLIFLLDNKHQIVKIVIFTILYFTFAWIFGFIVKEFNLKKLIRLK